MKWVNKPEMFSWFYFLGFLGVIAFCTLGIVLGKIFPVKKDYKKTALVLFIAELILIALELFKQIFILTSNNHYDWNLFPFQICSMIVYVLPILSIFRKGIVKEAVQGFIAFFCVAGATFYFFKPAAALNADYILISLQSFLWHWLIIGIGSFIITSYEMFKKKQLHIMLGGYVFFIALAVIAAVVDYIAYLTNPGLQLNYFYIAYDIKPFYPVLNLIFKEPKPYLLYFVVFLIYFGIGALAIYGISRLIDIIVQSILKINATKASKAKA